MAFNITPVSSFYYLHGMQKICIFVDDIYSVSFLGRRREG